MKYKDKSNVRINKALDELAKVMNKEERGFLFAPMVQLHGNHSTFLRAEFSLKGEKEKMTAEITTEEIALFWATIMGIVCNFQTQVPEDLQKAFKEGFIPAIEGIAELCFPSIEFTKLK